MGDRNPTMSNPLLCFLVPNLLSAAYSCKSVYHQCRYQILTMLFGRGEDNEICEDATDRRRDRGYRPVPVNSSLSDKTLSVSSIFSPHRRVRNTRTLHQRRDSDNIYWSNIVRITKGISDECCQIGESR